MSNPLALFRRHQKALLAVFGVAIIFVFVVGGYLQKALDTRGGGGGEGDDTVLTWKYGNVSEREIGEMQRSHLLAARFVNAVVAETEKRQGTPKAQRILPSQSEEDVFATFMLAKKAEQMGMVVSDAAIRDWLFRLSDDVIGASEFDGILTEVAGERIQVRQMFDQLKIELLAQNMRMLAFSGVTAITPSTAWDYHRRLNRRVSSEMLPLQVVDYLDQVKDDFSDKTIEALFNKHKNDYPHPESPTPGFRQRRQIAFEYFKVEFEKYLEVDMKKVTEEEIKAEYQKRIGQGQYKISDAPGAPAGIGGPFEAPPAPELPEDKSPAAEPTDPKPEEQKTPEEQKDSTEKQATPKEGDQGRVDRADTFFVSAQEEEKKAETETEKKSDAKANGDTKAAEAKAADDKKGDPKAADDKEGDPKAADDKEGDPKAADDKKGDPKAADDKQGDPKAADPKAPAATDAEKKDEKFKPLEDVREEIARSLARPKAQARMDEAVEEVKRKIDRYSQKFGKWKALKEVKKNAVEPERPDFTALASENEFTLGHTRLMDQVEIGETEIGSSFRFSFAGGQIQTMQFGQIAFQSGVPLYKTDRIEGSVRDVTFVFWRTEEVEERIPELKDARGDVVLALRMEKALELAKQDAKAIRERVAESGKSLRDAVSEKQKELVIEPLPFTWMSMGNVAMSRMGTPQLSRVDRVDSAGHDFMESVFSLQVGDSGVAVNQPKTTVYVVRLMGESPSEEMQREQFIDAGLQFQEFQLSQMDRQTFFRDWYDELEEEMKVVWQRERRSIGK